MKKLMSIRTLATAAALALPVAAPLAVLTATPAHAGVLIQIGIAPPPLPGDGYIWTPGYWAYGDGGYFWVPGVWVRPPQIGFLWTPAYWGWEGGYYRFHDGYWGPHIGFYGGINYGFGYGGFGYDGGYWRGGGFFYNRAVVNFGGVHVTNVYERNVTVINNTRVAFNGGQGGVQYRPRPEEQAAMRENHVPLTGEQMQHQNFAAQNPGQRFSANGGRPAVTAAATPAAFHANPTNPQAAFHGNVNARQANQDQRIANGVRSGQMTSGEAARADQRQANIDQQVRNDRAANGGALTQQQRNQINREQNGASRQIYNENHNGNTVGQNQVNTREANQQQRIANGQRDGQMTSGEAARAQQRQANIDQQVHNDRAANGGALNQQQRQQVNREQNGASRQIYNENHNAQQAPRPAPAPRAEAPRAQGEGERKH